MYMKIAIQYFGETRYFDIFSKILDEYRCDAETYAYSVDFHITTWDNDYTRGLDFSNFDSYHLIESPQDGIKSLMPKKQDKENREGASRGFFNPSYSMFRGAYNRFQYQKKNDIHYDWIILMRPDFIFTTKFFGHFVREMRKRKKEDFRPGVTPNDFHIIYHSSSKNLEAKWSSFDGQDAFWVGTQEAIDLFCKNFHLCFLNDDGSFISTYHNLPKHAIDRYHLFHDTVDNNLYPNLHKIRPWVYNYPTRFNQLTPTKIKSDDKKK